MAGRAAETIAFNRVCTGAYSDFQNATKIATDMVKAYGMGVTTGMMSYVNYKNISQETQREIDLEIQKIVQAGYDASLKLLTDNLDSLNKVAQSLLEKETLCAKEVYGILNIAYEENKKNIDMV
jgi:cell division protease FtsH